MAMPAASYMMSQNCMPEAEEQSFGGRRMMSKAYLGDGGGSGYQIPRP